MTRFSAAAGILSSWLSGILCIPMIAFRHAIFASLLVFCHAPVMAAPEGTIGRLVNECRRKWLGDPGMIQYCIERQNLDYQRVQRSGASAETVNQCKQRWGDDYGMVLACVRNPPTASSGYQRVPVSNPSPQRSAPSTKSGTCSNWILMGNKKLCL
jgi:hypothetical protein